MKTFEINKNAKELGIDTTRKFVVVDNNGNGLITKGDIVKLQRDDDTCFPFFNNITQGNKCVAIMWSELAYADKTIDDVEAGDVLVKEGRLDRLVEGRIGNTVLMSYGDNGHKEACYYHIDELKNDGWEIRGEETQKVKEVTMKEVCEKFGQEVKIIADD